MASKCEGYYVEYNEYPRRVEYEVPRLNADVNVVPTLEEAVSDYQYGCQEAFNYLFRYYKSKLEYNVNRYHDEDVFQELSMILHRCAKRYRAGGSSKFNTFFWTCAQNHLGAYTDAKKTYKRRCNEEAVSLDAPLDDEGENTIGSGLVDEAAAGEFDSVTLKDALECTVYPVISKEDRYIINLIAEGEAMTSIGRRLGVSTMAIYNRLRRLSQAPETKPAFLALRKMITAG